MDGQLFWSTGQKGDPEVLANLVCDLPQVQRGGGCINQFKSNPAKDTWEKRRAFADAMADEMDLPAGSKDFEPRDFLPGFDD
jgi:hypothetical protein|tara:strand:+ start:21282 stop:21527 length:246 start_codon:yes stop_codon:yes gene_type:complete